MKDWDKAELEELIHQARNYHNTLVTKEHYEKEFQVWGDESFSVDERNARRAIERMLESKLEQ